MCRSTFQKGPADGGRRRSVRVSITVFQGERKAWGEGTRGLFKPRRPHLADHRRLRGGRKRTFRNNYTGRIWPDITTGVDGDGPGLCRRRGARGECADPNVREGALAHALVGGVHPGAYVSQRRVPVRVGRKDGRQFRRRKEDQRRLETGRMLTNARRRPCWA